MGTFLGAYRDLEVQQVHLPRAIAFWDGGALIQILSWVRFCLSSNPLIQWGFPKIVVPQNGWFIMENPIKMDDLGVPLFLETPIYSKSSHT